MGNVRVPARDGWVDGEDGPRYHGFPFQSSWTGKKGMLLEFMFPVGNGCFKRRGKKLNHDSDIQYLPQGTEAYLTHGMEDYFEPAIHIRHNDNNSSLLLKYVDHSSNAIGNGVNETVITLKDDKYPVTVKLHYVCLKLFILVNGRFLLPVW